MAGDTKDARPEREPHSLVADLLRRVTSPEVLAGVAGAAAAAQFTKRMVEDSDEPEDQGELEETDEASEDEPHEWSVLTASFLLQRSALEEFHSAVADLAERSEQRLQMRCLAPLPPYSFVDLPLEPIEAEAAWAS